MIDAITYDGRTMRNGPPKLIDFRKVEGKRLYIDLIERMAIQPDDLAALFPSEKINEFFLLQKHFQITQTAAQHILWGK